MDLSVVAALLSILGAGIGVWVRLNNKIAKLETQHDLRDGILKHFDASTRVTRLETQLEHTERQFHQINQALQRIESKLDTKADRA
jgi:uncharacterized protein HemX